MQTGPVAQTQEQLTRGQQVRDLSIEANDLRIILQKAGHTISGIAKSVDQALASLKKEKPDIVLLDIYLKGPLALDIADYRHKHAVELMLKQEKWLSNLLGSIINEVAT